MASARMAPTYDGILVALHDLFFNKFQGNDALTMNLAHYFTGNFRYRPDKTILAQWRYTIVWRFARRVDFLSDEDLEEFARCFMEHSVEDPRVSVFWDLLYEHDAKEQMEDSSTSE